MPLIRSCRDEDLPAVTAIYAHHVLHGTATFETEAPDAAEMAQRRQAVLARALPWLVAAGDDGQVLGYAYCNRFKPRAAYRYSAEDSNYQHPDAVGHGLGRALLDELAAQAQRAGVRKLIAVIGDGANAASIGLHRAAGFAHVGVIGACGWKFGRWLDIVLMEKALGDGSSTPPTEISA